MPAAPRSLGGEHETGATATSARGDVVVRRHLPTGAVELRVNGVLVMHSAETGSERLLARTVLEEVRAPARVLVGGLGLGITVRTLLDDVRVRRVVVAEIEPAVVAWAGDGTLPGGDVIADPRVEVQVDDVRRVVAGTPSATLDAVLLDVDNGPDALVHAENAAVYEPAFLTACRRLLAPGGALAVWSSTPSRRLAQVLTEVFGGYRSRPVGVRLQGRHDRCWLFTAGT